MRRNATYITRRPEGGQCWGLLIQQLRKTVRDIVSFCPSPLPSLVCWPVLLGGSPHGPKMAAPVLGTAWKGQCPEEKGSASSVSCFGQQGFLADFSSCFTIYNCALHSLHCQCEGDHRWFRPVRASSWAPGRTPLPWKTWSLEQGWSSDCEAETQEWLLVTQPEGSATREVAYLFFVSVSSYVKWRWQQPPGRTVSRIK